MLLRFSLVRYQRTAFYEEDDRRDPYESTRLS